MLRRTLMILVSLGLGACGGGDADGDGVDDGGADDPFTIDADGETVSTLRLSPDGTQVAVVYGADDRVGVLGLAGGAVTDVAPGGTYLTGIAWADDATLLFTGDGGIYSVALDGSGLVMLDDAFAASGLDVSPDGTTLAYGVNGGDGVVLTLADSTARVMPTRCGVARFSPDGATIACDAQGSLVLVDVATLVATTLIDGLDFFAPLDWFADGTRLAVAGPDGIEVVDVATGARTPLTDAFAVIDLDLAADDSLLLYRENGSSIIHGVPL